MTEPVDQHPEVSALKDHWDRWKQVYIPLGLGFILGAMVAKPSKKKKRQQDLNVDNLSIYITAGDE